MTSSPVHSPNSEGPVPMPTASQLNAPQVEAAAGGVEGVVPARSRRRGLKRRGSIIVLALGVLAILAIAAVSYVAIVRVDRSSVVASQRVIKIQPQVNTVTNEIGAILAADLFGNKIVTSDTPASVWPSAFEDGDTIDYPRLDTPYTGVLWGNDNLNTNAPNIMPIGQGLLTVGSPEDAWLASTNPVITTPVTQSYWPQITNLRSAYRYEPRSGSRAERWKRGDGQYIDLMQWFLNPTASGNANPAADLSANNAYPPSLGTAFFNNANLTANLDVFGTQMNRVEFSDTPLNTLTNDQERFWCDTDGDLRPDARWQRVDALGNAFGLNWVVAARIIDASSLVNFNSSTMFPYWDALASGLPSLRNRTHVIGTGETPADVDLPRLLGYSAPLLNTSLTATFMNELGGAGTIWPVPVLADRLLSEDAGSKPTFREMLFRSMGFEATIRKLSAPPLAATDPDYDPPYEPRINSSPTRYPFEAFTGTTDGFVAADYPTASQRAVWWDLLTADSEFPAPRSVQQITLRDFADLHAFRGTNNTTVTGKLEQYIDGPDNAAGYLPGSTDNAPYGPLRSREGIEGNNAGASESPRRFGDGTQDSGPTAGLPTIPQLTWDNRHLLTPISGVGRIGPVPILNTPANNTRPSQQTSYFDNLSSLERINLPELEQTLDTRGLDRDTAQRVFDAFVWALAPLATDRPLTRDLSVANLTANTGDGIERHYGGTTNGPAQQLVTDTGLASGTFRSAYALLKALGLTVNLMDALDSASSTGGQLNESPTAVRFLPDNSRNLRDVITSSTVPLIGARLAQGNLPAAPALPERVFGNINNGVTVVGVDRQPFLVQASYYALYEDAAAVPSGQNTATINPNDTDYVDQMGSIIAFELRNPWPQPVDLAAYSIVMRNAGQTPARQLSFSLSNVHAASPTAIPVIPAGGSVVCYFSLVNSRSGTPAEFQTYWDDVIPAFEAMCVASGGTPSVIRLADAAFEARTDPLVVGDPPDIQDPATLPPVFADYLLGGVGSRTLSKTIPVLLVRNSAGGSNFPVVVDRLSPKDAAAENFPNVQTTDFSVNFGTRTIGLITVNLTGRVRILIPSTFYRPTQMQSAKGFPAYIAERRECNETRILALGPNTYNDPGGDTDDRRQSWVVGPVGDGVVPDVEPTAAVMVNSAEGALGPGSVPTWRSIGAADKGLLTIAGTPYAGSLSLFSPTKHVKPVPEDTGTLDPNTPPPGPVMRSSADLLLLPTVATLYVHPDSGLPRIDDAADLTNSYTAGSNKVVFATNLGSGKGAWITASEQLGSDWELNRDPVAGATIPNPYAGMLDPTQYVLSNQMSASTPEALPDALTIPLALRVVDAFDGLKHRGDLAVGKINLNTAPARVLQCVPFLSPLAAIQNADDATGSTSVVALPAPVTTDPQRYPLLYNWLLPWRSLGQEGQDAGTPLINAAGRATLTNIPNFRQRGSRSPEFGLTSVGELGAMARWNTTPTVEPVPGSLENAGFAYVGANTTVEKGVPFGRPGVPTSHVFDDGGAVTYRLTDGPEERAALLRALSNVVSTRSDVFIAWFVLRGYDPDVIESIPVSGNPPNLTDVRNAMKDERFRPTVDTRWLVVYDRSNVKRPTDRPKVLLQMELPSAKP